MYIDDSLNVENAKDRNLEWVYDSIYDSEAPAEANKEFKDLVKDGYVFGTPTACKLIENGGVGVYKSQSA